MRQGILVILFAFFAYGNNAKCVQNHHDKINSSLSICYSQYLKTRNNDEVFLALKKKQNEKSQELGLMPINPLKLGLEPDYYLDYLMKMYQGLMLFRLDNNLLIDDYDFIAQMQCDFDIWIIEQTINHNSIYSKQAKQRFVHNLVRFQKWFDKDSFVVNDADITPPKRSNACYYIYFKPKTYTVTINPINELAEKITNKAHSMKGYYVLIDSMVDWKLDGHEAKLLAKKRLMFVANDLEAAGIKQTKIRGEMSDKTCDGYGQNVVKVCILDSLTGKIYGRRLIENFDFKQSGKKKEKVTRIKK